MIRVSDVQRTQPAQAPIGQKGPRAAILVELKRAQRLTATELAEKLGASLNAIRHHLERLESEGLIAYDRERRGVGAPVYAYRLTEAGDALFPRRYAVALLQLLDSLVEREGREAAAALLESQFETLERRLGPELEQASCEERLALVARALADEGFMAEWNDSHDGAALIEHNCAMRAVAERFPEVCAAEERFLANVLGAEVERRSHILEGCSACSYHVRFRASDALANKETG